MMTVDLPDQAAIGVQPVARTNGLLYHPVKIP
jgi:hypothetical protein